MEKEPFPGPFCGGKAKRHYKSGDERNGYANTVLYRCESCFVQLGATGDTSKPGYADNSKIEQQALEKWNQRVPNAELSSRGAADAEKNTAAKSRSA